MLDSFVLLAPLVLLPVVALLSFSGCFIKPDPPMAATVLFRINCGGPAVMDAGLEWAADTIGQGGITGVNTLGSPVKVALGSTEDAGLEYETWRQGASFTYQFANIAQGDYTVVLKFAVIQDDVNFKGKFRVTLDGGSPRDVEPDSSVFGVGIKFDQIEVVQVSAAGTLTISFLGGSAVSGTFALINAIEIRA